MIRIRTTGDTIGEFNFVAKKSLGNEFELVGGQVGDDQVLLIVEGITDYEATELLRLMEDHINGNKSQAVFNIPNELVKIRENVPGSALRFYAEMREKKFDNPLEMAKRSAEEIANSLRSVKTRLEASIPDYDGGVNA